MTFYQCFLYNILYLSLLYIRGNWQGPYNTHGAGGSEPGLAQRSEFTRAKARERKFREPQEGEQSGETLKEIKNRISRCSADGSAPALGAGCRRFESCHLDHRRRGLCIVRDDFFIKVVGRIFAGASAVQHSIF